MTELDWLVGAISAVGGFVASVSGFGIGSLITPVLDSQLGTKLAVAVVSVPHAIGTGLRFWTLRHSVNRRVLWSFGITSAGGGLVGALLHAAINTPVLTFIFASLLVFAGVAELGGWSSRWHLSGPWAWIAGAASGLFGGLVGNQGGIRSAAMFGFKLTPEEFVGTATAIALFVDLGRLPVYLATEWTAIHDSASWILIATAGVAIGTLAGLSLLPRVPEKQFRRVVAAIILALGTYMFTRI